MIQVPKLRDFLQTGLLPGPEAQFKDLAPALQPRRLAQPPEDHKKAGVLIFLYQDAQGVWHTALMQRPESPYAHSKQVSWPGGGKEDLDLDLSQTALREFEEEFGLGAQDVELLGGLSPLYIPVSNYYVHPFVGCWQGGGEPIFQPDPNEVEAVLPVPLTWFLDPQRRKRGEIRPHGSPQIFKDMLYYDFHGRQVWGATAMIINEFVEVLRRLD